MKAREKKQFENITDETYDMLNKLAIKSKMENINGKVYVGVEELNAAFNVTYDYIGKLKRTLID